MSIELLARVTCPHCWTTFAPEDILWISSHQALRDDDRLFEAMRRFLPSRFTVAGEALDAHGLPCTDLACPHCHLSIPRAALEMEPYFVSVVGTPFSGKSYFLAALTWELNRHLPETFAVNFRNADPGANLTLTGYERNLFMNPDGRSLKTLRGLIEKTQQGQKGHFDTVVFSGQEVHYPRPFAFALKPAASHPNVGESARISRLLYFYDIAGEQCLPGSDSFASAATRHLAASNLLMFVFDPLQDVRFRNAALGSDSDNNVRPDQMTRQDEVLHEVAIRVRRYTGLAQNAKHDRPFVVVVTKSDAWANLVDHDIIREPWFTTGPRKGLNITRVQTVSYAIRQMLLRHCREIVHVAEDFAEPLYVPVSALGCQPVKHPELNEAAIHPADIKPRWVTTPLLAGGRDRLSSLVFSLQAKPSASGTPASNVRPAATASQTKK